MRKLVLTATACAVLFSAPSGAQWQGFQPVQALDSGLQFATFDISAEYISHYQAGGIAAGDVNGDGYNDLVLLRGDLSPQLYLNDGDRSFTEIAASSGLTGFGNIPNGVLLADIDGDGDLDLITGGVAKNSLSGPDGVPTPIRVMLNDGMGVFSDATVASGLSSEMDAHSMAMADVDGDGHLDLSIAYWEPDGSDVFESGHLWRNLGNGVFEDISQSSGVTWVGESGEGQDAMHNFTPNFSDINADGRPDLLMAADFGKSRVLLNAGDGEFVDATDRSVVTDENGMGATVGDFTNTGAMDWFVASIHDPDITGGEASGQGTTGNRFYSGNGEGDFLDDTDLAGVREGFWSWGACAQDFNNDGWLDLFVVNGHQPGPVSDFKSTPSRLYLNNGDGSFTESAASAGVDSNAQGRSLTCFDVDHDGQVDVLVQNSIGASTGNPSGKVDYYRNQGHADHHWLQVQLKGRAPNQFGVGARITLEAGGLTQTREIRAGNNYLGHDPMEAHFGLAQAETVDRITIRWPDGEVAVYGPFAADQRLTLQPQRIFSDRFRRP